MLYFSLFLFLWLFHLTLQKICYLYRFSKAFDKVDHFLLIKTLNIIGIVDDILSWLHSYLSNRTQYMVSIHGSMSYSTFSPSSGVPQVVVFSRLLSALFINSAPSVLLHAKLLILQMTWKHPCILNPFPIVTYWMLI